MEKKIPKNYRLCFIAKISLRELQRTTSRRKNKCMANTSCKDNLDKIIDSSILKIRHMDVQNFYSGAFLRNSAQSKKW